ncbi:MAG TPA: hypothetical protein VGL83_20575 [Stellaceae bacterium]|jgi:predicted TIM-barrel fold metal-dependent hydrolase
MIELSRRAVIAGLGTATLLPDLAAAQSKANPRRIDVHHHTEPPFLLERTRAELLAGSPYGNDVVAWTPERSLEQMDRWGIATAILSNPTAWASFKDEASSLCRRSNEYSAQLRADHKGRFGFFGGAAARYRCGAEGGGLRARYVEGRRYRPRYLLRRQMAGRSAV